MRGRSISISRLLSSFFVLHCQHRLDRLSTHGRCCGIRPDNAIFTRHHVGYLSKDRTARRGNEIRRGCRTEGGCGHIVWRIACGRNWRWSRRREWRAYTRRAGVVSVIVNIETYAKGGTAPGGRAGGIPAKGGAPAGGNLDDQNMNEQNQRH